LDPIKHVILLMLENRSFDQMLGAMQQLYSDVDGVPSSPGDRTNVDPQGTVFKQVPTTDKQMPMDPKHDTDHVRAQLSNNNTGFVRDFAIARPQSTAQDRQNIMAFYPLNFLPALHTLARDFTICDRWFSSLPGPTWPNRFFALSGTSNGSVEMPGLEHPDLEGFFKQDQPTLFDRLNEAQRSWKVYFYDFSLSLLFNHQRQPENLLRYRFIDHFFNDVKDEPNFPDFVLIEPKYTGVDQNDDHPPHNIMKGEKLIADVFNAIRSNEPLWSTSLLIVTFDEHGGFYDHVVPPRAANPDGKVSTKPDFDFTQLGVRVPALLISPYTRRRVEHTIFDHTSMLKYLTEKWNLGPLGARTAAANSIGVAIAPERATSLRVSYTDLIPMKPELEQTDDSAHHAALEAFAGFLNREGAAAAKDAAAIASPLWANLQGALGTTPASIGKAFKDDLESFIKGKASAKAAR
jgi:phospholipase C